MIYSYIIKNAKIKHSHASKENFIDVTVQILVDDEVHGDTKRFSFKLNTPEDAIRAELDRVIKSLKSDAEHAVLNVVNEAKQKKAKKTIEALLKNKSQVK